MAEYAEDLGSRVERAARGTADAYAGAAQAQADMAGSYAELDYCVATMRELSSQASLTEAEQARLADAVGRYNAITGESVTVTDAVSGSLDASTESLRSNVEAWKRNAEAQALAAQYGDYSVRLVEARALQDEAERAQAEAQKVIDDLVAQGKVGTVEINGELQYTNEGGVFDIAETAAALDAYYEAADAASLAAGNVESLEASVEACSEAMGALGTGTGEAAEALAELDERQRYAADCLDRVFESVRGGKDASEAIDEMRWVMEALGVDVSRLTPEMVRMSAEAGSTGESFVRAALEVSGFSGYASEAAGDAEGMSDAAGELAEGAEEAGEAVEGLSDSLAGMRSTSSLSSIAEPMSNITLSAEEAAGALDRLFGMADSGEVGQAEYLSDLKDVLDACGQSYLHLSDAELVRAYSGTASAEAAMAQIAALESQRAAAEELAKAEDEERQRLESLCSSMADFADSHAGMRAAIEASGRSLDEFALALDASGIGLDSFKSSYESLASCANPLEQVSSESGMYTWKMRDNLQANLEALRSWRDEVQLLYSRVSTDQDALQSADQRQLRQFADFVAGLGVEYSDFLWYLNHDADVGFGELASLYDQALQEAASGSVEIAVAMLESIGMTHEQAVETAQQAVSGMGDAIVEGADGEDAGQRVASEVSDGMEAATSEVESAARAMGDAAADALTELGDDLRDRANAAAGFMALGLSDQRGAVEGAMAELASAAAGAMSGWNAAMEELGRQAAASLGSGIAGSAADVALGCDGLAEAAASSLGSFAAAMGEIGREGGSSMASALGGCGPTVADECGRLVSNAAEPMSGFATAMGAIGQEGGRSLASGLGGCGSTVSVAAGRLVSNAAEPFEGFTAAMATIGQEGGRSLASGIGGCGTTVGVSCDALVWNAAQSLGGLAPSMSAVGSAAGVALASGLRAQGWEAQSAASSLAMSALSGLSGFNSSAYLSGREMGANFAAGLRSQVSAIASAASSGAGAAAAYLHHTTPDKGPLRGDDEWGAEMGANIAAGLLASVRQVEAASEAVARAAAVDTSAFGEPLTKAGVYDAILAARSSEPEPTFVLEVDGRRLTGAIAGHVERELGAMSVRRAR